MTEGLNSQLLKVPKIKSFLLALKRLFKIRAKQLST